MKSLTLGEIAKIEGICGTNIEAARETSVGRYMAALLFVLKKRTNPDFTLNDAYDLDTDEAAAVLSAFEKTAEVPDPKD